MRELRSGCGMKIRQKFVGGSLDGREMDVEQGLYSFRVPKPFIPTLANESLENIGLDVETYLYDRALGKFVEESMASDGTISWQQYEMRQAIGQILLDANPDILEVGIRQFHKEFNAHIVGEIISISQKVGLKLNAVKYLLDKNEELTSRNKWIESKIGASKESEKILRDKIGKQIREIETFCANTHDPEFVCNCDYDPDGGCGFIYCTECQVKIDLLRRVCCEN